MAIQYNSAIDAADECYSVTFRRCPDGKIDTRIQDNVVNTSIHITLTGEDEAQKLLDELNDPSGNSMWDEDAICEKYPELHDLRP